MIYRRDGYRQFSGGKRSTNGTNNGVPTGKMPEAIDALVISLKRAPVRWLKPHSNRWRL